MVAAGLSIAGSKRLDDDGLWQRLGAFGRLLVTPDGAERLLLEYMRLWPVLLAFTAKKFALGVVALVPLALAFGCLTLLDGALGGARAAVDPDNLAWSSMSDWEFHFFAAACLASLLTWVVAKFKA